MKLSYLAVPYSHPDPAIRAERFHAANLAAGELIRRGHIVFSPISHTHPIAEVCDMPKGWDFWHQYDRAFIAASRLLVVLCIEGWDRSVGVAAEFEIAREVDIPIMFMTIVEGVGCVLSAASPNADIRYVAGHAKENA